MLVARIKEYGIDDVLKAIDNEATSDFLQGSKGFIADFEWFVRPNNFPKVLEGKYNRDKPNDTQQYGMNGTNAAGWEE